jgi:hypothetical protein
MRGESFRMQSGVKLKSLIQSLEDAQNLLDKNANLDPGLRVTSRALRRIAGRVNRPFRVAILGESNSGKSSIANLIAGEIALPALPVANTRIPTLLYYAPVPVVEALHDSGERFSLAFNDNVSLEQIVRLEVGLPSKTLADIEILDFPGSENPLFQMDVLAVLRHRVDAAIWATGATQAWRETERVAWCGLPARLRRRGLLAVTHRDLITSEDDFRRLRSRLETIAKTHFSALCFVAASQSRVPGEGIQKLKEITAADLRSQLDRLRSEFQTERFEKAAAITRRLASDALVRIEKREL